MIVCGNEFHEAAIDVTSLSSAHAEQADRLACKEHASKCLSQSVHTDDSDARHVRQQPTRKLVAFRASTMTRAACDSDNSFGDVVFAVTQAGSRLAGCLDSARAGRASRYAADHASQSAGSSGQSSPGTLELAKYWNDKKKLRACHVITKQ